jgi:hypothetical protein
MMKNTILAITLTMLGSTYVLSSCEDTQQTTTPTTSKLQEGCPYVPPLPVDEIAKRNAYCKSLEDSKKIYEDDIQAAQTAYDKAIEAAEEASAARLARREH